MNKMTKLMHYDIFNTVSGGFQEPFVQRNDPFLRQARPPSCIHASNPQGRCYDSVFLEYRVNCVNNFSKNDFAFPVKKSHNHPLFFGKILRIFDLKE